MKELLSVIVPCYNEAKSIRLLYRELRSVTDSMSGVDFEFLFIDDGSADDTLIILAQLAEEDDRVKYISFSRNFGKEAAMFAGFENCRGDYAVVMDADLQDPPSLLPEMLRFIREAGYDSVATRRVSRKGDPRIRSFFAGLFYKLMRRISKTEFVDGARDYRLMTRKFLNSLLTLGEYNRFSKGLYGWVGYRTKWLEYENVTRSAGETKWSFLSLLIYSLEGIASFSAAPLAIASVTGLLFCAIAALMIVYVIFKTLAFGDPVAGWPSMICVILLIGGIQLFCMGILGQYLSKTYLEVKKRPLYLVKKDNLESK